MRPFASNAAGARVLGAVAAALLAFTAVPVVLVVVVGNPLSGGLGHTWASESLATRCVCFTLAAWVAWAACCAQLLRACARTRAPRRGPRRRRVAVLDRLAARIAVGVLALSSLGGSAALSAPAGATIRGVRTRSTPRTHDPRCVPDKTLHELRGARPTGAYPGRRRPRRAPRRHASGASREDQLDDGADWTALAALNLGRDMGRGQRFVDPDQLRAGWRLRLPDEIGPTRVGGRTAHPAGGRPDHLPELVALGLGSLACAALARRARRGDRARSATAANSISAGPPPMAPWTPPTLLHRFDGVPALPAFEAANGLLGRALDGDPEHPPCGRRRLARRRDLLAGGELTAETPERFDGRGGRQRMAGGPRSPRRASSVATPMCRSSPGRRRRGRDVARRARAGRRPPPPRPRRTRSPVRVRDRADVAWAWSDASW